MNEKGNPCPKSSNPAQCFLTAAQDTNTTVTDSYKRIWKSLAARPKQQSQLQAANDLWLRTRSADCEGERDMVESAAAQAAYYACLEAENRQRTAELQTMYGWWLKSKERLRSSAKLFSEPFRATNARATRGATPAFPPGLFLHAPRFLVIIAVTTAIAMVVMVVAAVLLRHRLWLRSRLRRDLGRRLLLRLALLLPAQAVALDIALQGLAAADKALLLGRRLLRLRLRLLPELRRGIAVVVAVEVGAPVIAVVRATSIGRLETLADC